MTGADGKRSSWMVGVFLLTLSACSGTVIMPSPTPTPTPQPGPLVRPILPAVSNPSSAAVFAADAYALVRPDGSGYAYEVRFLLKETSGKSGAIVDQVDVYGPGDIDIASSQCWRDTLRMPASGTLDTFYTQAGAAYLGYCSPGSWGRTPTPEIDIVVAFRDDRGVRGSILFPVPVR